MATRIAPTESHVKLATPELPPDIRSGGEKRPLGYPHLYQIQAGDWRISYAVEHNRLAILVLEVLNAGGEPSKDPAAREDLTKKMKVKLLNWPEGSGSTQMPPEEISKKLKIKWLDLTEEAEEGEVVNASSGTSRIKLKGSSDKKAAKQTSSGKHKITLLDGGEAPQAAETQSDEPASEESGEDDRKITPVDEPSM